MDLNDRGLYFEETYYETNTILDFDLWYVDIHNTLGYGEFPFIEMAYTLSFLGGVLYANNNLVDIGITGNGYGIPVGTYSFYNGILTMDHLIDGFNEFEVYSVGNNVLELYNVYSDTSYFIEGLIPLFLIITIYFMITLICFLKSLRFGRSRLRLIWELLVILIMKTIYLFMITIISNLQ